MLEERYYRGAPSGIGKIFGDFLGGRQIDPDDLLRGLGEIFGGGFAPGAAGGAGVHREPWGDRAARAWGQQQQRAQRPPPSEPPPDFELRRALLLARQELGFEANAPVTIADVERRRKDLARKHHPDLGGSPERMVRINQAADLLVAKGDLG